MSLFSVFGTVVGILIFSHLNIKASKYLSSKSKHHPPHIALSDLGQYCLHMFQKRKPDLSYVLYLTLYALHYVLFLFI